MYLQRSSNHKALQLTFNSRKTSLKTATSTTPSVYPVETFANITGTFLKWSNGGTTIAPQITLSQYVSVAFVPLILAVVYTIPWRILDNTVREMEPFYQLSQPAGAKSENSLLLGYGTSFIFMTPWKALANGHFIVFWTTLISLAVLVLTPLSSEAFFVSLHGTCGPDLPATAHCQAAWGYYPKIARTMEGLLAFVAVLLFFIIIFNYRRKSGVYSDPLSIAGLGALAYKSPILKDLNMIDSEVKNKELRKILAGKRFGISEFWAFK